MTRAGDAMDGPDTPDRAAAGGRAAAESLREAVRRNPRRMTPDLAREFGVPEVEVIRALPDGRAVELDVARWEQLFRAFEALGSVWVLVSSGAATVEVLGRFGGFGGVGEFFNVRTESLDLHVRWRELAAAFAVEKPGHMGGPTTYSVQFFDRSGAAALKVFVNFGEPAPAESVRLFGQLRERFRLALAL
jgi:putative heme iron utilization protein